MCAIICVRSEWVEDYLTIFFSIVLLLDAITIQFFFFFNCVRMFVCDVIPGKRNLDRNDGCMNKTRIKMY